MTDVTVLGAGLMGSAIASAILASGRSVTVWNRTIERARPLADAGAVLEPDLRHALAASPVVVSVLLTHDVVVETLAGPFHEGALEGRTLINLTTTIPPQVRELADLAEANGAQYLDGVILGYPENVGHRSATVLCAGPSWLWNEHAELIRALGGRSHLVSDDVVAAAVVDVTTIGMLALTMQTACIEAMAYAAKAGIPATVIGPYLEQMAGFMPHEVAETVRRVTEADYTNDRASLDVILASLKTFDDAVRDVDLPPGVLTSVVTSLDAASAAGLGDLDAAAYYRHLID